MTNLKALVGKLNPLCNRTLEDAAGLCLSRTHYNVEVEHWLLRVLEHTNTDLDAIAHHYELALNTTASELTRAVDGFKTGNGRAPTLSPSIVDLVREAWLVASVEYGEHAVRTSHLLIAALSEEKLRRSLLSSAPSLSALDVDRLKRETPTITRETDEAPSQAEDGSGQPAPAMQAAASDALAQFTIDLTAQAKEGKIDRIVGRDAEVRQLIDVLCRRRQNNPILTGEAGVGKTAVVEGFALKIAEEDVPPALRGVSLRTLDLSLLQAGAGVKGEFENRLKNVIEAVQSSPKPIILFIDEAHNLVGAGGQAGQGDAANLLKPALARGELRTIAATTWAEYKKYFERDAALARRFQVVSVDEPTEEVAVRMLRGLVPMLEKHHGVRVLDEAVQAAVGLSKRYISGRQLPDKAVSVLDTTCARIGLTQNSLPAAIEDAQQNLEHLKREAAAIEREGVVSAIAEERKAEIATQQAELETQLQSLTARWEQEKDLVEQLRGAYEKLDIANGQAESQNGDQPEGGEPTPEPPATPDRGVVVEELANTRSSLEEVQGESPLVHGCCDAGAIAATIAAWTGIPVGRMRADEVETLMNLESLLEQSVVGQSHALRQISETIRTGRARLTDPGRPVGVFMLVGTSGVGKTETALSLAELLYGGDQNLTVINMSEFKEEHKVSLLMGSPPGYVGYGEGGILTEAVRRKPYSVLLLDEFEKAHPGVQDVFYQVFDKGWMKDGEGREIDFRNTIIIMTSNAGTDLINQLCADPDTAPEPDGFRDALQPQLLEYFKPAFLGRSTVIPYYPIGPDVMRLIVGLKLKKVQRRVESVYRASMAFEDKVVDSIVDRCTEVDSGARNVDKILNKTLLPQLSSEFLAAMGEEKTISGVNIGVSEGGEFTITLE